jgi:hypothetical protein
MAFLITGGGSVNWNTTASWSLLSGGATGAPFPTAAIDATGDVASGAGTLTVNVSSACLNYTFNAYTGTFAGSSALAISGNATFGGTITYTGSVTFAATTTGKTIASNSKVLGGAVLFNGVGGGWTLADAFNTSGNLSVTNGAFDDGGFPVTMARLLANNANTRSITQNALWTVTGDDTGTVAWQLNTVTGLTATFNGTVKFTSTSSVAKTFQSGHQTYNIVWFSGAGTGMNQIVANSTSIPVTIGELKLDAAPKTVTIASGQAVSVTTLTGFTGSLGNLITLNAVTPGTRYTITKTGAIFSGDYLSITDLIGGNGYKFFAGDHSTNGGNNLGVAFMTPRNASAGMGCF